MYIDLSQKKHTRNNLIIEIINVILGIAIITLAILTFLNTEEYAFLFPVIFLLGAIMNGATAVKDFLGSNRGMGIVVSIVTLLFFVIFIASAVVVWR